MLDQNPWIQFPRHLSSPTVRSLALNFILSEIAENIELVQQLKELDGKSLQLISFFSLNKPYPSSEIFPNKLCYFCHILVQASKIGGSSIMDELNKMRLFILETKASLKEESSQLDPLFFEVFRKKIEDIFSSLVPFLYEAKSDENILIKLLEIKNSLECLIGSGTIQAVLKRFFPLGHAHLRTLIHEGLTKRSFTPFLSEKEALIDGIEWETACHIKS